MVHLFSSMVSALAMLSLTTGNAIFLSLLAIVIDIGTFVLFHVDTEIFVFVHRAVIRHGISRTQCRHVDLSSKVDSQGRRGWRQEGGIATRRSVGLSGIAMRWLDGIPKEGSLRTPNFGLVGKLLFHPSESRSKVNNAIEEAH